MYRRLVVPGAVLLVLAGCTWDREVRNKAPSRPGPVSPAESPSEEPMASFVAFGDWGTGGDDQKAVAAAIGSYCATERCEFILTLGDNFYSEGVEGVDDGQWGEKYRDIYGPLGLPFYASLGNHDNDGSVQAQIDYSRVDSSWHMPAEDYSFSWPEGSSDPVVEFFIFNSDYPHFRDEEVQQWLDGAIGSSQATWKILVMHHPIYSNGNHGDDDQGNNEVLLPIICNRVDLVLSGHDHSFEYLRSSEDGCPMEQVIIGTGGAGLRDVLPDERTVSSAKIHGFGWFEVTPDQITFRMIQKDGDVFYTTAWEKF